MLIKSPLLKLFHNNNLLKTISQETITYIMFFLLVMLVIIGVLSTSTTQTTFGNVSQEFQKARNNEEFNKPHRYFNIDFDQIFPPGNE